MSDDSQVLMSARLTEFITQWLRINAVGQIAGADDLPYLVSKCVREASERGITRQQLEAEVGPLDECIRRVLGKPSASRPDRSKRKRPGRRRPSGD